MTLVEGIVAWRVDTKQTFANRGAVVAFYRELTTRAEAVPGVEGVGLTDLLPLTLSNLAFGFGAKDIVYEEGERLSGFRVMVDDTYLQTMGISLVAGRYFTPADDRRAPRVTILNESAAERLFPGQQAVGQRIVSPRMTSRDLEVVGVVRDVRHHSLEQGSGLEFYVPLAQFGGPTLDPFDPSWMGILPGGSQDTLRVQIGGNSSNGSTEQIILEVAVTRNDWHHAVASYDSASGDAPFVRRWCLG